MKEEQVRKFIVVAAVGGILHSQGARATSLEDILRDKGVLNEEDYQKVTKSQPVAYKLGDGFTFTSADGKYQGAIGGFMQLRYTFLALDKADDTSTTSVQNSSAFAMNRVKLFFNGYSLTPDLTYKLQLNITKGNILSTGQEIEEAYLNYRFLDEAQIRFGQDKVPFARQFIVSSANQQFIDLSHVATAFAPGYDNGLTINGRIAGGLVNYNVGVFGGVGQGMVATSSDNAIVGRIAVNPLGDLKYTESDVDCSEKPLVSAGANYYSDTVKNGATTNLNIFSNSGWIGIGSPLMPAATKFGASEKLNVSTLGYDAAFKWRGLYIQGEYFLGRAAGQTTNHVLRAQGGYGQAGYFILPKQLELAARYACLDPNREVGNDRNVQTTGTISWYINKHNLKLQADFTNIHKQAALAFNGGPYSTDDKQVRLQAQIIY